MALKIVSLVLNLINTIKFLWGFLPIIFLDIHIKY
nr:MAG TPA: hypothetical protein [Caudoviricetes sp.]